MSGKPGLPASLSGSVPSRPSVFTNATNQAALPDRQLWAGLAPPYATNSWWTNMMLGDGGLPVLTAPYLVKAPASGLEVGYPWPLSVQPTVITSPMVFDWQLAAAEKLLNRQLIRHDPLTATLSWAAATATPPAAATGSLEVPLAQGSPYITAFYTALTPTVTTPPHAILSPAAGTYCAASFTIALSNGQTWRLYASSPITLTVSIKGLTASQPFTGALRLALVPTQDALPQLDASSDAIPINSSVFCGVVGDLSTPEFRWGTRSLYNCSAHKHTPSQRPLPGCSAPATLLMLALPHQADAQVRSSAGPAKGLDGAYLQLLGPYTGLLGAKWQMREALPTVDWQAPRAPAADKMAALKASLGSELDLKVSAADPYFGASQAAAIGQQALIADMLGDTAAAAKLRTSLKAALDLWLAAGSTRLLYDTTWGGIVSAAGLQQSGADFGSGIYNDHHFHYGYLMYAAAALGAKDPAWLKARTPALLDIIRDFANPGLGDPYFPFARQMDFYAGHSWASGLWGVWDVKNQESSSEAVHSYYALALLAKAMGNQELVDWGRLLMAMEIRAARKYFHITSASTTFPEPFKSNKAVGILWATKADYATFFGAEPEKMHCIQHIPYRPHTELLLPAGWVAETLPILRKALLRPDPPISPGFRAFVHMAQAVVDPEGAWRELQAWKWQWDGPHAAMTKTAALWWAATRPAPAAKPAPK